MYDLTIIGGGINGCAIAREASLNGWSVLLVEKDDLAAHTSSASTKLIHGGLRYLEQYAFRLVREALVERERLMAAAPHLIAPIAFVLPHDHAVRPWWIVRAGLWLYDALGLGSSLPRSRGLKRGDEAYRAPLVRAGRGFVYWDAQVDDARLTIANAIDAAARGADIRSRTAFESARRSGDRWRVTLAGGETVESRALAVAGGAWTVEALARAGVAPRGRLRLVKGSHIVVPRLYDGEHAYILQQPDRRIVFAIPWQGATMIGTTDIPVERADEAVISREETDYLCEAANRYFRRAIGAADVVGTWSGVRALYDDGASAASDVTRDYVLELDDAGAPVLSVFGGKITTARALAEDAVARLGKATGLPARPVTRARVFPGGAIDGREALARRIAARWPFLPAATAERFARTYGARAFDLLDGVEDEAAMGAALGGGLTALEVRFVRDTEWARTPADVARRIGMALPPGSEAQVAEVLASEQGASTGSARTEAVDRA
jgi:glycerol-3-phosphate dehydrogenase